MKKLLHFLKLASAVLLILIINHGLYLNYIIENLDLIHSYKYILLLFLFVTPFEIVFIIFLNKKITIQNIFNTALTATLVTQLYIYVGSLLRLRPFLKSYTVEGLQHYIFVNSSLCFLFFLTLLMPIFLFNLFFKRKNIQDESE